MKDSTKTKIYSIVFWASMSIIVAWMILKAIGMIQSPVWQELIPYAGGIFMMGTFYQMLLEVKKDVYKIAALELKFAKIETKIEYVDRDVCLLRSDVEVMKKAVIQN